MNAGAPLLDVNGLTRRFGGLVAVNDVTFRIAAGEIAGLIGPNGAGKTTLFNMLAGSMPPSDGRITFQGTDCTGLPAQRMARLGIARTFQITSLFPGLSTIDNIIAASYRTGRTGWGGSLLRTAAYRQEEQKAAQQAPAEPAAAPAGESSMIEQLKQLGELKSQGILTEEEFAAQKAKLLGA